jgi:pyruvate carboxylase
VVAVAVQAGQPVRAGDTLLAIEAMKMETHICAERDAVVEKILVAAGDRVDAKALLILLRER